MTSRERVQRTLRFQTPDRIPRDFWALPWFWKRYPAFCQHMAERFPSDFGGVPNVYRDSPRRKGDQHGIGTYVDEWGCSFIGAQDGVIGEVKHPMLTDLEDWRSVVKPPYETLPEDFSAARDTVNRACAATDLFVKAGCNPRPWERYQFLRGSYDALCDMADPPPEALLVLQRIHEFHLREVEFWATTDVDAISFMDDWGAQRQLLIRPDVWRAVFKPLYKEYADIAHAAGKTIFMHSDGHTEAIYPDLVEIGIDAFNSQLFCMDIESLSAYRGKITFWGEIDRQHILPSKDPEDGRHAVRRVRDALWLPEGGIIAELEAGLLTNPEVVEAVYEEWDRS